MQLQMFKVKTEVQRDVRNSEVRTNYYQNYKTKLILCFDDINAINVLICVMIDAMVSV